MRECYYTYEGVVDVNVSENRSVIVSQCECMCQCVCQRVNVNVPGNCQYEGM